MINEYAAKCARADFLEAIKKAVPELLKDKEGDNHFSKIMKTAEKNAMARQKEYISSKCSEYAMPHFIVPIDIHYYE